MLFLTSNNPHPSSRPYTQAQYKSHFVAASSGPPKLSVKASSTSGWTSAGSLSSVPTESSTATATALAGFASGGTLSSLSAVQPPPSQRDHRPLEERGGRHGDGHHRHGEHHGSSRNGEGRREREREGEGGVGGGDSFAVPDPPKRRKSRWDN